MNRTAGKTTATQMPTAKPKPVVRTVSTLHNVFALGKVPYVKAETKYIPLLDRCRLYLTSVGYFLLVSVLSLPWIVKGIVHLVVPRTRKNVFGQTALVTGAGNGIGKAIALRLAHEGCNIAVADIDRAAAEQTVAEVKELNVDARAYVTDVAKNDEVVQLHADIKRDMGGAVDILVNNAGFMSLMSLRDGTVEELDRIIKINLYSHFYTIRTFLPDMMQRRRGHIVGISSMSGIHPTPHVVIYTAAKHGILALMKGLQAELRKEGYWDCIKFTTVHPYFVSTRQDIMDVVQLRYPPVTPERVAEETVEAILTNMSSITVPWYLTYSASIFSMMPDAVQNYVRDFLLFEDKVKQENFNAQCQTNGVDVAKANGTANGTANGIVNGH